MTDRPYPTQAQMEAVRAVLQAELKPRDVSWNLHWPTDLAWKLLRVAREAE